MPAIIFDIETAPLEEGKLRDLMEPFPPFDPESVKYGNTKDEAKRTAKLAEEQQRHEAAAAKHAADFIADAALSPRTGRVVAVGYYSDGQQPIVDGVDPAIQRSEFGVLEYFWQCYSHAAANKTPMVGFNIFDFDLPFLVRRSWLNGVPVPSGIIERDRYWSPVFIDLREKWRLGCYGNGSGHSTGGLDGLCKSFGVNGKLDIEEHGGPAAFGRLWEENREVAVAYLVADLRATWAIAERMGVC